MHGVCSEGPNNLGLKIENGTCIENLKHVKMLDLLGKAWQSGSALAALTLGRATANKHRLCGYLLRCVVAESERYFQLMRNIFSK